MPLSFPTLQELRSVHAALAWLLARQDNADSDIIAAARLKGLVLSEDGPHWKVDDALVTGLTEDALGRLPGDPDRFGEILHGIGEMAARSHAPTLSALFVNYLKALRGQIPLQKILDAAVKCDTAIPRQVRVDEIALAQWLTRATLEWSTFDAAVSRIGHPDRVLGRFGLGFAARVILGTDTSAIDGWIAAHPDHPAVAVIGSAALTMVFPFDTQAAVAPLLESKNAAIKCLGAASIVCPVGLKAPSSFRDCHRTLVAAGFAVADATWMTGMRIKNAVHARYRIEHGREQDSARLLYVDQNPDKAMGGLRNADAEITMLRDGLNRAEEAYLKLLPELEAMFVDMAADWPAEGLSREQMVSLDHIFVDTAEIRHRLAAKLSHQTNRDWLLKRNITRLEDFIGLKKNPAEIPKEYFLPDERRFAAIEKWTAESLILLYDPDNRGVGKRTSDLVSGVAKAATDLIAQPFISGRQPEHWQSVMTRSACAGRFAFAVVASTPTERRDTVVQLNELALDHAFTLLSAQNPPSNAATPLHELTAQAVEQMGLSSSPDALREKWALAETLPAFSRALALWSSPTLVEKHMALACDLFQRVGTVPLSHGSYNVQMSRMLTLLDVAIASSVPTGKDELIACICQLWKSAYRDWLQISIRWEGIAGLLASAVEKEGSERAQIVADRAFANSYCRRLIDSSKLSHVQAT
jgi:hypothetical protein